MKSPFPGMDPYLERHWGDVHQSLCTYARDQLQEQLGGPLIARLGERLVVGSLFDKPRALYPSARIMKHGDSQYDIGTGTAVMDIPFTEPIVLEFGEQETQPFIEIIEPDSARLVTVVEFLSPSNKWPGDGRDQYQRKQRELAAAKVNQVEIDLIRAGPRVFTLPAAQFPPDVNPVYAACVYRAASPLKRALYAISLQDRLPVIRVPLRPEDADIALNVQLLVEMAYRNGRYDRTDYLQPCIPPLEGPDKEWADGVLKSVGKRVG